jgi:hypothetical protein
LEEDERRQRDEDSDLVRALESSQKDALMRQSAEDEILVRVMEESRKQSLKKAEVWVISQKDMEEAGPSK